MDEHHWEPLSPGEAASLFAGLRAPWWVAGGWAIDLFVGQQTRAHGDLDIAVLRRDQLRLRDVLAQWDVCVAHDGRLTSWAGAPLEAPQHQFWVRRPGEAAWRFEVLLEECAGDRWMYRRDVRVALPLERVGEVSADGVPYLRPEIALLYKAPGSDVGRNAADFAVTAPLLGAAGRAWLREALRTAHAGHAWVERL